MKAEGDWQEMQELFFADLLDDSDPKSDRSSGDGRAYRTLAGLSSAD